MNRKGNMAGAMLRLFSSCKSVYIKETKALSHKDRREDLELGETAVAIKARFFTTEVTEKT